MSTTKVTDALRNVTAVDAAKITTGTVDVARLPSTVLNSNVDADLTPAHQGIANLGLIMATEHDKVAFNLTGSFIDIFQDNSGIATETNVDRNASEYVSSTTESFGTPAWDTGNRSSSITSTTNVTIVSGSFGQMVDGDVTSNQMDWNTTTATPGKYLRWQWTAQKRITGFRHIIHSASSASPQYMGTWQFQGSNDGSTWVDIGSPFILRGATTTQDYTEMSGNTAGYTYYQLENTVQPHANGNPYHKEMEFLVATASSTVNATGTLISNAQTVASTSEMSGVFTYTDSAGTNTIGTDLKIYFTANNGTNWTEAASYGTATTFSGSIKQVKLGKTTVTAGTQVALKAVWANQAATVAGGTLPIDSSSNSHTLTAVADATTSTVIYKSGVGTQSMQFDGTGDWYTVPDGSWADLGTGDFTMEAWVYYTGGSGYKGIIGSGNWGGPNYNWSWDMNSADRYPRLSLYNGTTEVLVQMTTAVATSTWTHLAVCRSGGTITQYLNGTANGTTLASTQNVASAGVVYIGNQSRGIPWQGNLQEVRMSNNARYTGTFTPSASAFVSDANTLLLVHGTGTAGVTGKVAHLNGWAVNY